MAKVQESPPSRVAVKALFEQSVVAELDALAEANRTSRSEVLRRLVRQALEEADGGEEDWSALSHRMLLAEYGPEHEGLYDHPEAIGATRVQ
jgi:metal-responsive CopG/Arc/MetJ family transcriptional regulator